MRRARVRIVGPLGQADLLPVDIAERIQRITELAQDCGVPQNAILALRDRLFQDISDQLSLATSGDFTTALTNVRDLVEEYEADLSQACRDVTPANGNGKTNGKGLDTRTKKIISVGGGTVLGAGLGALIAGKGKRGVGAGIGGAAGALVGVVSAFAVTFAD